MIQIHILHKSYWYCFVIYVVFSVLVSAYIFHLDALYNATSLLWYYDQLTCDKSPTIHRHCTSKMLWKCNNIINSDCFYPVFLTAVMVWNETNQNERKWGPRRQIHWNVYIISLILLFWNNSSLGNTELFLSWKMWSKWQYKHSTCDCTNMELSPSSICTKCKL